MIVPQYFIDFIAKNINTCEKINDLQKYREIMSNDCVRITIKYSPCLKDYTVFTEHINGCIHIYEFSTIEAIAEMLYNWLEFKEDRLVAYDVLNDSYRKK